MAKCGLRRLRFWFDSQQELSFRHGVICRTARSRALQIREANMLSTVLLIVLILLLVGAIPSWPHSRGWGYGPSGILGVVLVVVLVLALTGRV
jgi:hypothetical protein